MPFCSERCRIIDLGNWAIGEVRDLRRPRMPKRPRTRRMTANCADERSSSRILLATWFGCGYSPVGARHRRLARPRFADRDPASRYAWLRRWHFAVLAAAAVRPCRLGRRSCRAQSKNSKDPQIVVVDEVLGSGSRSPARARLELEELPRALRPVPPVRYLEAAARPPTGSAARRTGHQRRRRDGGHLCRTCVIRGRMVQSLLNMPLRKSADSKPQISQVTPPAAIAGGELQIRGKGLRQSGPARA